MAISPPFLHGIPRNQVRSKAGERGFQTISYSIGRLRNLYVRNICLSVLTQTRQQPYLRQFLADLYESEWLWKPKQRQSFVCKLEMKHIWWPPVTMNPFHSYEYSFFLGCLGMQINRSISDSFASSVASIIIRIHVNRTRIDRDMAVAVSGSNQASGYLEQTNYVFYLVSRVWSKSPARPLSNAPGFKGIRQEMTEI